jgi:4'-phosphopantetheinyl transferase
MSRRIQSAQGHPSAKIQLGEVQVWHASVDRLAENYSNGEMSAVLDHMEIERLNSLPQNEVRREFLATRYLIRTLLSYYYPAVAAKDWIFRKNEFGKPITNCKMGTYALEFNISHSGGIIVCVFSLGASVGVDIEADGRNILWPEIAEHSFSKPERDDLNRTKPDDGRGRFFEYWTLKEAFIKSMGMGLSLPLEEFWFQIRGTRIGIGFSSKIAEMPADWQFRLFKIEGHQCALAVKSGRGKNLSLVLMGDQPEVLPKLKAG